MQEGSFLMRREKYLTVNTYMLTNLKRLSTLMVADSKL